MANVLYISYDGMFEPLGRSQVLNYLKRLSKSHKIVLISYEKKSDWRQKEQRKRLKQELCKASVIWKPMRYHKDPSSLATAYDILRGILTSTYIILKHRIKIVHARSYVPSVIALVIKKLFNKKFIFDMRGYWADERVDGDLWQKNSRVYKVAKWFEKKFLTNADCVVSLTKAAINDMQEFEYLQNRKPWFENITTCTDLDLFNINNNCNNKPQNSFTLGYVGSVGVWYLFDEVLKMFKLMCERGLKVNLHIINRDAHKYIAERISALNIDAALIKIEALEHNEVAAAMQNMDAGMFFYKPAYSKIATAPTKLGEFLGCGVPCISNRSVGDVEGILENDKTGAVVKKFEFTDYNRCIDELLVLMKEETIKLRCRNAALKYFSLDEGVEKYNNIYNKL